MPNTATVQGSDNPTPKYARAAAAARHFQIGRSTLWEWARCRAGFPKPIKAGPRVALFDLPAIERFISGGAA